LKKLTIALCFAITFAVPVFGQSCPHPNTQLSTGTNSKSLNSNGRQSVGSFSAELWADGKGTMSMTAYGDPGGGSAFKANWGNAGDFLARVGYYWGSGNKFTSYNNICADYNYVKTGTAGGYNYIGVYGWTKNPTIEYYIVDDWWGDNRGIGDIEGQIKGGGSNFSKKGSFEVDGGTYNVYQNQRNNAASINGNETFQQYFSVRTSRRTCGTISVTEHFKKWASLNMNMGNMYEASITVEAGGGTGTIDYRYGKMSQVTGACGGTSTTSSNSTGGGTSSSSKANSSSSVAKTQATTCKTPLITYPTSTVPSDPYTACFKYTNNKCYVCKVSSEGEFEGNVNTCASGWVWDGTQIASNLENGYWYQEVTCPATSSSSVASSSSKPSSSSVAASSSSKPSSSSVASSSSSKPSSSSTASSSSKANSSSSAVALSSSGTSGTSSASSSSIAVVVSSSSSEEDLTPILKNRAPITYFSIQPQSGKTLRIEISSPTVVEIFDLKGKKVEKFEVSSTLQTVSLSSPNGVYFAKVHGMKSIRFVLK